MDNFSDSEVSVEDFAISLSTPTDQPGTRMATITGCMTIAYGREIKAALLEAVAACDTLIIDLGRVAEIDLVGLQFLCSTHRALMEEGKRFEVRRSDNQVVLEVARTAGVLRQSGCVQGAEQTCVWAGGGNDEQGDYDGR